jgi:hypothetical protein
VCYDRDSEEHLLGAVHPQDAHMDHEGKNPHHVRLLGLIVNIS